MELNKDRGDVVSGFGTGDDSGGRVLDDLESVEKFVGETSKD